jgi:hypothetical protein
MDCQRIGNMTEPNISHIVRRYFQAYESKVRNDIEALLGNDFVFSSPHDNRIDRQTYLAQCWPFAKDVEAFHIEKLFENGNEAFVTYLCQPIARPSFRNTEFFRVENGKVQEVVVYFGRTIEEGQPAGA